MKNYIGVDVSKRILDVDYGGHVKRYCNDENGIKELTVEIVELKKEDKLFVLVCEATGGYEQNLVRACRKSEIGIHVAHANKVRYFAKSKGIKAKTDKIDAQILTQYGHLMGVEADKILLSELAEEVGELLKRKEQLQADRTREKNRLDKLKNKDVLISVESHIDWLTNQIKGIDKKLSVLGKGESINKSHEILTSIPSIGNSVAYYLIASLPELGKISNKAAAALVGVAPYNRDSGTSEGKRFIQGGRGRLRQILYMSAITSIRCNADLKTFYLRLRASGKPTKVAITAVMRKLISLANSLMRRQTTWQEKYQIA